MNQASAVQPQPPEDVGLHLAAFARGDGSSELRVRLKEFNGHPFFDLRIWKRDYQGRWWPTKSGCSIRPREFEEFNRAMQRGMDSLGEPSHERHEVTGTGGSEVRYVERGRKSTRRFDPAKAGPAPRPEAQPFDEF